MAETADIAGRAPSVMVVDDDPDILEIACRVLSNRGYRVVTASNGVEALRTLRRDHFRPRFILLDLMMPIMNGREFRSNQDRDPSLKDIPVVLFSGENDIAETASELHSTDFVQKPISIDQLVRVAQKYCGR